jgi:hypothetical protein
MENTARDKKIVALNFFEHFKELCFLAPGRVPVKIPKIKIDLARKKH